MNQNKPEHYTAEEMGEILGMAPSAISEYGFRGVLLHGEEGGVPIYFLNSLGVYDVLKQEMKKKKNKGRITREGTSFVINKESLDDLIESVKIIRPEKMAVNAREPRSDKGTGYLGALRAYVSPVRNIELRYENSYSVDTKAEADQTVSDFTTNLVSKLKQAKEADSSLKTEIVNRTNL